MLNLLKMNSSYKIPVFPLKGVIVFPQSFLPLNIFEPRYLSMVDDALKTDERMIGIVQPNKVISEANNLTIHEIGCLTKIIKFEELEDKRFLVTLKGISRFRAISEEMSPGGYKKAKINFESFEDDKTYSLESEEFKFKDDKRLKIAIKNYFDKNNIKGDLDYINSCENKSLINQISMLCPFNSDEKQMLLESKFIEDRYILLISLLEDNLITEKNQNAIKH